MGWTTDINSKLQDLRIKVRNSFRGQRKRDLLTFVIFLVISFFFWFLQWMKEDIEMQMTVPIEVVNVPKNILLTTELPKSLHVNVKDKGATILSYYFSRPVPVYRIDFQELAVNRGKAVITPDLIVAQLSKKFVQSLEITSVVPSTLTLHFSKGESKVVPVSLLTSVATTATCGISGEWQVSPSHVTIYAPADKLKEITRIYSELIEWRLAKDTIHTTVLLQKIDGVKIVPQKLRVMVPIEPFSEKKLEVPISVKGAPLGYTMRIFPVKVNLVCRVPVSRYDDISANDFKLVVDFSTMQQNADLKYAVRLVQAPAHVSKIRFQPEEIEVLMEENR